MYTEIRDELPKIELNDEALEVKKLQNKRMYECRDQLKNLSWRTLNELSKENGQPFHYDRKVSTYTQSCLGIRDYYGKICIFNFFIRRTFHFRTWTGWPTQ